MRADAGSEGDAGAEASESRGAPSVAAGGGDAEEEGAHARAERLRERVRRAPCLGRAPRRRGDEDDGRLRGEASNRRGARDGEREGNDAARLSHEVNVIGAPHARPAYFVGTPPGGSE